MKPGEKISIDGVVISGESYADESFVTGESKPVFKRAGDLVIGGTINSSLSNQNTVLTDPQTLNIERYMAEIGEPATPMSSTTLYSQESFQSSRSLLGTTGAAGTMFIKATRIGNDTALSQIINLVETAQISKPPIQNLVNCIFISLTALG